MFQEIGVFEGALLIFLARICDVSLGTIRIVLLARGHRIEASLIGFFESLIWILVTASIIRNLANPVFYVAFAGGFAFGNYVGLLIEGKLALGKAIVRVFTRNEPEVLIKALRDEGFVITTVNAEGRDGPIVIIFAVVNRKDIRGFLNVVDRCSPGAFYTIEDIREAGGSRLSNVGGVGKAVELLKRLFWPKRK